MKSIKLILIALLGLMLIVGCEDTKSEDNGNDVDVWIGTWLSAGADVAPILAAYFLYDSVRVEFKDDNTLILESHVTNAAWSTLQGTYVITESATGDIHKFAANYTAFEQEGIIEITAGSPDVLKLEAVQTVPDLGATIPAVAGGFGADPTLGTANIQTYKRVE